MKWKSAIRARGGLWKTPLGRSLAVSGRWLAVAGLGAGFLLAGAGRASASEGEMAEARPAAVRNRLYENAGRFEAGLSFGGTPVPFLTRHLNLDASVAWNPTEQWAVLVRGGYALSSQTATARDAAQAVTSADPTVRFKRVDDFSDLWKMRWSAAVLVRWMPIYGKANLFSALPVHFGIYLSAGAGVGGFEKQSLVVDWLEEDALRAVKPLFSGALGARIYLTRHVSLSVELGDRFFPDSYRVDIDRAAPGHRGQEAESPGLTHLVFVTAGVTWSI